MKQLPIIMTTDSACAILAKAKNQTRRTINPQPVLSERGAWVWKRGKRESEWWAEATKNPESMVRHCRYQVGDLLWVRETWEDVLEPMPDGTLNVVYAAHPFDSASPFTGIDRKGAQREVNRWNSPRFMPRWASRIALRVDWCRVERLQDITEDDAKAEGAAPMFYADGASFLRGAPIPPSTRRTGYRILWDEINGKKAPWETNPWVNVIGFTMLNETASQ